tara:strand:+ start:1335 stop:2084 length:750 start_codon:yes stop_codon:yes gene_type:complete
MIKLFRNIRKNLLTEGKTTKYFKYAIGEIILVVIGIIIALQVNTWNGNRKESIEEKALLESLYENFIFAKKQSEELITEEKELLIQILGVDFKKPKKDSILITNHIFKIAVWDLQTNKPTFNIYSNLKSTNKLSLIKNNNINQKFTDLEFELTKLDDILQDRLNVHQIRIDNIFENDINFIPLVKSNIPEINIDDESKNNYNKMLKLQRIRNLLGMKLAFTQDVINIRKNLDNEIGDLINLIKSELNEK